MNPLCLVSALFGVCSTSNGESRLLISSSRATCRPRRRLKLFAVREFVVAGVNASGTRAHLITTLLCFWTSFPRKRIRGNDEMRIKEVMRRALETLVQINSVADVDQDILRKNGLSCTHNLASGDSISVSPIRHRNKTHHLPRCNRTSDRRTAHTRRTFSTLRKDRQCREAGCNHHCKSAQSLHGGSPCLS